MVGCEVFWEMLVKSKVNLLKACYFKAVASLSSIQSFACLAFHLFLHYITAAVT